MEKHHSKRSIFCVNCKAPSPMDADKCSRCGSNEFTGYDVENPYSKLPMAQLLKVCGHIIWLLGLGCCIGLLWQTSTPELSTNLWYMIAGFGVLFFAIIWSVTLFAIAELLRRTIRIQRKQRAFMEDYYYDNGDCP